MISLRLLGGLDLRDGEGRELHSVLAQPKRTALLSYLALAGPGYLRRDQLIAVFWPESSGDRARKALRQATFFLRRSLGADAILSRGDEEIGLNAEAVSCDVTEFEELIGQHRLDEAIQLYRGELLPGFHVDGLPEFDSFIDARRMRFQRLALDTGDRWLDELIAAGRTDEALLHARWLVDLAPADSQPVDRLLRLLEEAGDLSGALLAFEEYARRIAAEYDLPPDPQLEARVNHLRATRRIAASPASILPESSELEGPSELTEPHSITAAQPAGLDSWSSDAVPTQPARWPWFRLSLLVVAVALVTLALKIRDRRVIADDETIAVFPFRVVSADGTLAFLGDGIPYLIAHAFTGGFEPRGLVTTDAPEPSGAMSIESMRGVAQRLKSKTFVYGSVIETSPGIIVLAYLAETSTGRIVASLREGGTVDGFQSIAHRLATALMVHATGQEPRLADAFRDASYDVFRAYLMGQVAYRHADFYLAAQHFRQATLLDANFAPAAFGLLLATGWTGDAELGSEARRLAWESRNGLPDRERDYVQALLGGPPAGPWSGVTDPRETLKRWEEYVLRWGDRPDGFYELGDRYLHGGAMAGYPDFLDRAEKAFHRALQLDSSYTPAYLHLVDVLVHKEVQPGRPDAPPGPWRDELRARADQYFTVLSPDERYRTAEAWRAAMALGDEPWLLQIRAELGSMEPYELHQIARTALAYGWNHEDAVRAVEILEQTSVTDRDARSAIAQRAYVELNAGRPQRADLAADEMYRRFPELPTHLFMRVEAALLGDGDEAAAMTAAAELEHLAAEPAAPDLSRRYDQYVAGFLSESWKLTHGGSSTVRGTIESIRKGLVEDTAAAALRPLGQFYTAYLDALLAATEQRPDALARALLADSVLQRHWGERAFPWTEWWVLENSGPVLIMRLHELRKDDERTLEAARRRDILHTAAPETSFLAPRLLIEARLAERLGDIAGARRAYHHYLALRANPEQPLLMQRRQAKADLDRIANR